MVFVPSLLFAPLRFNAFFFPVRHFPKLPCPSSSSSLPPYLSHSLSLSTAAALNMPPKQPKNTASTSASAPDGLAALEKRIAAVEQKQKQDKLYGLMKQKKQLLNAEMKSYSDNFAIKGIKYAMKDVKGNEEKQELAFGW